jgi:aminopeptidase-like protein
VKSRIYDRTLENVTTTIMGASLPEKEVLVTAHICRTKQSANDNASGPVACLEAARALQRLINVSILERPKRAIWFLFPPETMGDHAFIECNGESVRNTVAGLNVNMVGVDPCLGKNLLTVSKS